MPELCGGERSNFAAARGFGEGSCALLCLNTPVSAPSELTDTKDLTSQRVEATRLEDSLSDSREAEVRRVRSSELD
jgi:hypothetical protein